MKFSILSTVFCILAQSVLADKPPHCSSPELEALCLASNADARCEGDTFKNNFPASCDKHCWCVETC
ncbi:hypothetical protein QBC38DRAFT_456090 [Podospora fimiseda]|uniref:Uncharacterized protein n=1 Tax=Podospora fimiseda TaxID=252190 RepID=A0AAN7BP56_9PEZI|nr:hypothetical protein QBC38DRAFT_456090 [Podospora fimiseda]